MEKCTCELLFSEKMHIVYEKEYEPQTAVVMYPLWTGIRETGANSLQLVIEK